eukprot:Blabericola_migrator_1__3970@NODE_2200_length_3138_cov_6_089547_g1385_i0_p4_GENE_NODE_2200_length_3138_cov_6_089547_g1385_i0NODE_2200_length_3138_cov_6_089547_g1385_i0_p4_ORF_typecomplete_len130_score14_32DUF5305/PF17231_2/0_0033Herpes_gE/PF02480_16/0_0054Rax2/PF12768_7/0_0071DUF5129/PF17173_4/0_0066MHYT/PF03707_16/0_011DUF2269/PF10027_9/0_0098SfLAP/PF11139_8/0_009DUF4293/PF14126_6/0_051DUF4293/PF14126_6/2_8e03Glycophorin_A/PF01102_18/0_094Glycophorin_A/PF01102_18/2_6e03Peptidase_M56/PF05569_11/
MSGTAATVPPTTAATTTTTTSQYTTAQWVLISLGIAIAVVSTIALILFVRRRIAAARDFAKIKAEHEVERRRVQTFVYLMSMQARQNQTAIAKDHVNVSVGPKQQPPVWAFQATSPAPIIVSPTADVYQ